MNDNISNSFSSQRYTLIIINENNNRIIMFALLFNYIKKTFSVEIHQCCFKRCIISNINITVLFSTNY